jgi:hypothetical protein
MFSGAEVRIECRPAVPDLDHHALAVASTHVERATLASRPRAYQPPETLQCLTDLRSLGIANGEAKVEFDHPSLLVVHADSMSCGEVHLQDKCQNGLRIARKVTADKGRSCLLSPLRVVAVWEIGSRNIPGFRKPCGAEGLTYREDVGGQCDASSSGTAGCPDEGRGCLRRRRFLRSATTCAQGR